MAAAIVLAHIRFRCEAGGPGIVERDGHRWWRVSHHDLGSEIGVTARSVRTALRALDQAVTAKHFPPLANQSLAYRVATNTSALTCQSTETSPADLPVDISVMPGDRSVEVPRLNGHLPATERSSAPISEKGEKGENAAAHASTAAPPPPPSDQQSEQPPSRYCPEHQPAGTNESCGPCKRHRIARQEWEAARALQRDAAGREIDAAKAECPICLGDGWVLADDGTPVEPALKCHHTDSHSMLNGKEFHP